MQAHPKVLVVGFKDNIAHDSVKVDVSGTRKQAWKDAENSVSPNTSLQLPITTQTITV